MFARLPPGVRLLLAVGVVVVGSLALDRLLYSKLLFALPNYSGWDSFRWYNFEYNLRRLEAEGERASEQRGRPYRVVIVGSSIAKYAVQEDLIERALKERGVLADVRMATHAAQMPTDLYYYRDRLLGTKPDLVVYPTNPADLDLERYLPPYEAGGGYSDAAMENYLAIRHPMKMYYPGAFALDHHEYLSAEQLARLALRQLFYVLRFKDEWRPYLRFLSQVREGPLRSYLNYQGAWIPERLWRDGWTGACFTIRPEWGRELFVQVPPELQSNPNFRLEFFARGDDVLAAGNGGPGFDATIRPDTCASKGSPYASIRFRKSDWQYIEIPRAPGKSAAIFVRLSHVLRDGDVWAVKKDSPVWLGRGLRLPGDLGRGKPRLDAYHERRLALEDARLRSLGDAEYRADFKRRVHPDDWRDKRALHQFNKLRLAKYLVNWYDWQEIYQAREARRFVAALRAGGTRVLLINNPENPLTRETYADGSWYRGYLKFYESLAEDPGVSFADFQDRSPMQEFVDAHHLTYHGVRRMAPLYADRIAAALATEAGAAEPKR